ncbi:MAG: DEAD/DEAH box helicase [Promethearchaeota archaeon]
MRALQGFLDSKLVARLDQLGLSKLHLPQKEAIRAGIAGGNVVVEFPTGAGKTLVAEVLIVNALLRRRGAKALYLCPLKALASEKLEAFKRRWGPLGLRVGLSTGDLDQVEDLSRYDWVVATNEKADALVRARVPWLAQLAVVTCDEVHLVGDASRGVTLEILLTRIMNHLPGVQLVALSATIGNSDQIAGWLGAKLVRSSWRPVPLEERVVHGTSLEELVEECARGGGQVLVFAPTRRSAKATALALAQALSVNARESKRDQPGGGEEARRAFRLLAAGPDGGSSELAELKRCARKRVAFHHAGLPATRRLAVERAFRGGELLVIVATTTLAAGINVPARRVLITSTRRYDATVGRSVAIPVVEYKQMAGRAGRPGYDDAGEAILLANDHHHARKLEKKYLEGEVEPVSSKLADEGNLLRHALGAVVAGFERTEDDLYEFLSNTLYGFVQRGGGGGKPAEGGSLGKGTGVGVDPWSLVRRFEISDAKALERIKRESKGRRRGGRPEQRSLREVVEDTTRQMVESGFLVKEDGGRHVPTRLGILTSKLSLDTSSATHLLESLRFLANAANSGDVDVTHLTVLFEAARSPGTLLPTVPASQHERLACVAHRRASELPSFGRSGEELDVALLAPLKLALVLERWVEETPEWRLEEEWGILPGDLHRHVEEVGWLVHAAARLASLVGDLPGRVKSLLKELEQRVRHGVRAELLELVRLRGVGRVRARSLYRAGFRSKADLRGATIERLSSVRGIRRRTAEKILASLKKPSPSAS